MAKKNNNGPPNDLSNPSPARRPAITRHHSVAIGRASGDAGLDQSLLMLAWAGSLPDDRVNLSATVIDSRGHYREVLMMRLIDDLAASRLYYNKALPTLPDILLIDIPPRFSGVGLALDRYYPVILETLAEMHEFEAFLCAPRSQPVPPALFDRRPSALVADKIIFARYQPQAPDWPWLLLGYWPAVYTAMVPCPADAFARGSYTVDAYVDEADLRAAEVNLLGGLGADRLRVVRSGGESMGHA